MFLIILFLYATGMVRTRGRGARGASGAHIGGAPIVDEPVGDEPVGDTPIGARRRPTGSACRDWVERRQQRDDQTGDDAGPSHQQPVHDQGVDDAVHDQAVDDAGPSHLEPDSFPGGPEDMSVLITYGDHVATRLWVGEVINQTSYYKLIHYIFTLN